MSETIERRALQWFASDDTGSSSKTIANHMLGLDQEFISEPADGSDLGRCLRLIAKFPEWESRIGELSDLSNAWAALVPHWSEIKQLMIDETGMGFDRDKPAPRTYKRIRQITDSARKADGWVSFGPGIQMRAR